MPISQSALAMTIFCLLTFFIAHSAYSQQSANEWESPEQMYNSACVYCHETGVAPVLKGRKLPSEYFRIRARMGYLAMPAFKPSELSDADLKLLGEWLIRSKPPNCVLETRFDCGHTHSIYGYGQSTP